MNSRERVMRAIAMTGPDRPPFTHATLPGAVKRYGVALDALHARYPSDIVDVGSATEGEFGPEIGVPSRDTWGSLWVRHSDEHKGQVVRGPLEEWAALDRFQPPDTSSDAIMGEVEKRLRRDAGQHFSYADGDILWQRMFYLHGYQATLEDLLIAPDRCVALRDMILEVMLRRVDRLCQLPDLDCIQFRDDWGTQESLMISPRLWRSFFSPAYAQLFGRTRAAGKVVWFHSDGVIDAIVPDLIGIGVQVLNPQVDAMGRERVAELCTGRVCIQADIDRQWVLPYGAPDDARAAVRADMDAFWRDGGYIGRAESAGDTPLHNLEAVYDELARYRPA